MCSNPLITIFLDIFRTSGARTMPKKKGSRSAKSSSTPGKAKLSMLAQIVSSYKPEKIGNTYVKETLEELEKQIKYQEKPLNDLIKIQSSLDKKRYQALDSKEVKNRGAAFSAWLLKHAPKSHLNEKFAFKWGGLAEGSGVVALKPLKKHEKFIQIPRSVMLTSTQASQSAVGKVLMKDETFGTMPNLMLAVHVMFESLNPNSKHRAYLDVLPRIFSLPLFFSAEDLKNLKGSPTYYDALKIQKQTLRQYVMTTKLLDTRVMTALKLPQFTFRDFRWAVGVVMTRQNRIPSKTDPNKHVLALIPGWDFCNFRDGELTTQFNPEEGVDASESFTMHDVKEGNQIFIYYGNRPNSKLFLFSGFVADDHKSDFVEVLFSNQQADPDLAKIRRILLINRRLKEVAQPFRIYNDGKASKACMTWVRLCSCNKEEASIALKAKTPLIEKLTERNEKDANILLVKNLEKALKGYDTSIEDDKKLLQDENITPNMGLAIRLRLREKIALVQCLERSKKVSAGSESESKTPSS